MEEQEQQEEVEEEGGGSQTPGRKALPSTPVTTPTGEKESQPKLKYRMENREKKIKEEAKMKLIVEVGMEEIKGKDHEHKSKYRNAQREGLGQLNEWRSPKAKRLRQAV